MSDKALTTRAQDFSAWYNELIFKAELADYSPVRGCMVIRPNGFAIWEQMQSALDRMFKETGHQNAYFPLFIPQSFLAREAEHVEGFAPEVAVVTHAGGKELEEPLVVRPTSETIIGAMFAKWIQSYRDLPVLLNQWCNVVRWEMRTRLFLRTTEFLWQEGHTAHATEAEAEAETLQMLGVYRRFQEEFLAIPVVTGRKTESEKFAGALRTYALEALMQDNKALQMGTSHNLGQNFAKAFDITFQNADGAIDHVWSTSWGSTTRMIGGMIMVHSDDSGFVCPPRMAQFQVVIVPIWKTDDERAQVVEAAQRLSAELKSQGLRVHVDAREGMKPGAKYYEWEGRGVPFRLELGPRDLAGGNVVLVKRTGGGKTSVPMAGLGGRLHGEVETMQRALFAAAKERREAGTLRNPKSKQEFIDYLEGGGGFVYAGWCGDPAVEAEIKEQTKATIRVIPDEEFRSPEAPKTCIWTGRPATAEVIWAKAY
ncbi:MAG: proline--tRNA ligase [Gemmatimonadales bacterium]|nr:proline--tRNA ligase [Gemmatimonadales bacterium]